MPNQKGVIVQAVLVLILMVGLIVGLFLIKQTNIFKSKASSEVITFSGPTVITDSSGTQYLTSSDVIITLQSPFGPAPQDVLGITSDSIPNDPQSQNFWDEFVNSFLISLRLKKSQPQEDLSKPFEISSLPVVQKLDLPDSLSPAYQANLPTPFPSQTPIQTFLPSPTTSTRPTSSPVPSASYTPLPSALANSTLGFRIAESPTLLESRPFLTYKTHPLQIHYTFESDLQTKTIFVQFQNLKGDKSPVYSKTISLLPVASATPSATIFSSPSASESASPSASASASPTF